jgi:hypothetical protein
MDAEAAINVKQVMALHLWVKLEEKKHCREKQRHN